ncbi:hypothetical protein [Croceibacterium salegens]|uniref:hypothetical protein n=1 Tax=Croceibacterium salegens TaxID=1737568 RepID=UPI002E25500E
MGTLDILSAFLWTVLTGGNPANVLPGVASGPFGGAITESTLAAPIGLLVHFAIMLAMVAVYVVVAQRVPLLKRQWVVAGLLYGLILWGVMYGIVLPLRFGSPFPAEGWALVRQLISHCLLVGLPLAWIARREPVSAA